MGTDTQPQSPITSQDKVGNIVAASGDLKNSGQVLPTEFIEHSRAELSDIEDKPLWYKDAVFYEVYVRAFCDLEGTGNGGITGITSKLDYLHSLGVDCVWLLPIYPSPLKDDGYDVSDYCNIHPDYGTLDDFKTLVNATHERNMKIIVDLVPNHCSIQHPWFQEARLDRNSKYRDWFVWTDSIEKYKEARIIFCDVEKSNWTWDPVAGQYYWHRFYAEQPDLNFDNPEVQQEFLNIMKFWMDIGVDGFRVDAVPYLFEREGTSCENLPETHVYLKKMRKYIEDNYPGRVMLAEACQMPKEVREYFGETGDEFNMGFHFPVMPRIYMALKREDGECLRKIMEDTPEIPPNCQWVTFLRNHDELTLEMVTKDERKWMWEQYAPEMRMRINMGIRRRLAPLMDGDQRRIEAAYSLLFTLPGSPIIYYGDEVGMGDNIWLDDRHGVRTPMQWSSEGPFGGFSTGSKLYSPIIDDPEYGFQRVNVEIANKDPSSLFHIIRVMIARRRRHLAYGHGDFKWIKTSDPAVASFMRSYGIDRMLMLHNLSGQQKTASVYLPNAEFRGNRDTGPIGSGGCSVSNILTDLSYNVSENGSLVITLEPYQYLWLNLGEMKTLGDSTVAPLPTRRGSLVPAPSLSRESSSDRMNTIKE